MARRRRPKKGSIHKIPLYEGTKPTEVPEDVQEAIDEIEAAAASAAEVVDGRVAAALALKAVEHLRNAPREQAVGVSANEDLEGVEVGVRYVGPKKAQRWQQMQTALQIQNAKALGDERQGYKREHVPELYEPNVLSEAVVKGYRELIGTVFAESAAFVDGEEGLEEADYREVLAGADKDQIKAFAEEVVEFLEELDFGEQLKLMARMMSLQSLRRSQMFPSAGAGVLDADGPAAA